MGDIDGLNQDIVGFENEIARCPRCGTEVIVPHGRYAECQDCGRTWVTEATAAEGRAALAAPEPPSPEYEPLDVPAVLAHWDGEWAYLVEMTVQQAIEGTHDPDEVRDCLIVENTARKAAEERAVAAERKLTDIQEMVFEHVEREGEPFADATDAVSFALEAISELWTEYAAVTEAHRALREAAAELTRTALAVNDNVWQPPNSDWLRVDDDCVTDMTRAAEACRDALAALEGESHD